MMMWNECGISIPMEYSISCIKIRIPIWKKNPTITKLKIRKEWMWYLHFFHLSDSELQVFIYLGIYKFECQHRYIPSFLVCEVLKRYQITASAFILIFQLWVIKKTLQRNNLKILTRSGAPKTSIRHTHVSHSFKGFTVR